MSEETKTQEPSEATKRSITQKFAQLYPDLIQALCLSEALIGSDTLDRAAMVALGTEGRRTLEVVKIHGAILEVFQQNLESHAKELEMYKKCVEQQNLNINLLLNELRDVKQALAFISKGQA